MITIAHPLFSPAFSSMVSARVEVGHTYSILPSNQFRMDHGVVGDWATGRRAVFVSGRTKVPTFISEEKVISHHHSRAIEISPLCAINLYIGSYGLWILGCGWGLSMRSI